MSSGFQQKHFRLNNHFASIFKNSKNGAFFRALFRGSSHFNSLLPLNLFVNKFINNKSKKMKSTSAHGKKSWREMKNEKRERRQEEIIKKLDKQKERASKKVVAKPIAPQPNLDRTLRTCSIAVPGSILENAQTLELRTYVAGQVARAACIYKVNEIIVFDDTGELKGVPESDRVSNKYCLQFARILQYLECPQYLRKHFFPIHKDLQFIGLINPLDAPHHLRQTESCVFREGVVTTKPSKTENSSYANIGLVKDVKINKKLDPGLRVTVKLVKKKEESKKLSGIVVSPDQPTKELDLYWGYTVRVANSLSEVMIKSPYPNGYDLTIGTSDKGKLVDELKKKEMKSYTHALIVFGGLKGLEVALENDEMEVDTPSLLFDYYLNTCPCQGSRTIRTEEAILITLAELRKKL